MPPTPTLLFEEVLAVLTTRFPDAAVAVGFAPARRVGRLGPVAETDDERALLVL